ncbi:glutathione peroxidase [Candidatus Berkiella cookevillensis]|uniref:Glutathione peroxidase n=1 Tax=Candidatus Berkiella cookevillensis TaxID=437022 RepID=A0A0Q9YS42_9GAMM|nr:glutathione peroxidase [Candidatus Berkiella cookevillensis]MCS5707659.1 glutathione peroxidase [Candidatus Berkiella cookevillensis]
MKKQIYALLIAFIFSPFQSFAKVKTLDKTAYDFSFKTLVGEKPMRLKQFEGKVLLIVNTASNCGFTSQYKGLEEIYQTYADKGLIVIGVPSNDFGAQEPGNNMEISNFCKLNYGVSFPMASKEVVSGDNAHPFYIWAKQSLGFGTGPKWNFHKYLINRKGELIDYFNSTTLPESDRIKKSIEKALMEKL